ncbi:hypothetical protein VdG1_08105 [Verticillium dahliae VDG1]|nr:hypothetical protein VdG1_08105 [Verticillium dahliae VDG1]
MHAPTFSHVLVAAVLAATGVQSFSTGAPGNQLARRMAPVVALAMPAFAMTTAVEERENGAGIAGLFGKKNNKRAIAFTA